MLSSAQIGKVDRFLRLGRFRIPLRRPELRLLRKSRPFWSILGDHRIWSTVLRVPITFPPDQVLRRRAERDVRARSARIAGHVSALHDTRVGRRFKEGGQRKTVSIVDDRIVTTVEGPGNTFVEGEPPLTVPLRVRLDRAARARRGGDRFSEASR